METLCKLDVANKDDVCWMIISYLIYGNELACMATNLEKEKMADGVELIETVQANDACGTTMTSNGLSVEDISEDTKKAAEEVKEKANECFKSKFNLRHIRVSGLTVTYDQSIVLRVSVIDVLLRKVFRLYVAVITQTCLITCLSSTF